MIIIMIMIIIIKIIIVINTTDEVINKHTCISYVSYTHIPGMASWIVIHVHNLGT